MPVAVDECITVSFQLNLHNHPVTSGIWHLEKSPHKILLTVMEVAATPENERDFRVGGSW